MSRPKKANEVLAVAEWTHAMDVALRKMLAEAWDEGYDAGSAPNPPDKRWNNPYRRGDDDD